MTEGTAVVIILLWVPPRPPSNSFSVALPKPCRRENAQRGIFVVRLSPISQNENNDQPFFQTSLEKKKNPAFLGGMGKEFLAKESNFNQELSGIYIDCDLFFPKQSEPQKLIRGTWPVGLERTMWLLNHCFSKSRACKIYLEACFKKAGSHLWKLNQQAWNKAQEPEI